MERLAFIVVFGTLINMPPQMDTDAVGLICVVFDKTICVTASRMRHSLPMARGYKQIHPSHLVRLPVRCLAALSLMDPIL